MVEITRSVRFFLNAAENAGQPESAKLTTQTACNGFSAWPAARGLASFYQLHILCQGQVNADTGYFLNIKQIDQAARRHAIPKMMDMLREYPNSQQVPMGHLMAQLIASVQQPLNQSVKQVKLELSPYYQISMRHHDMAHVLIDQQYEFSSAHRLHVPHLSDAENRNIFGKCNNPSGHGHNYHLQVSAKVPIGANGRCLDVHQLDELVSKVVLLKLDHKHLNIDVPEFADLNPSVENIAKVIHQLLEPQMHKLKATLEAISVWETTKTKCTYMGKE